MSLQELTMLLARIQVLDNRQVDQLTIEAWEPLMEASSTLMLWPR